MHNTTNQTVGGKLERHTERRRKKGRHTERKRAEKRSNKAHGKTPGPAAEKAAQQRGNMHGAEHGANFRNLSGQKGQHQRQRQKNIDDTIYTNPPLTTIDTPSYYMGQYGAMMVYSIMNELDTIPMKITLPCKLIIRDSCKKI